jgi:hypothetical protein
LSTGSWRRISTGDPDKLVLAVDFDSTARPEAGFHQLAALLTPTREIWLTTQPDAAETGLVSAEAYLEWWRERPEGARGHVDTIMGYCVGSVFGCALAGEIATVQGSRPALLLVDPEQVVTLSLYRDFEKTVETMSMLSEQERADHIAQALAVCGTASENFDIAAVAVIKLYETAARATFDRLGLDEETTEDLLGLFRSYVAYLSAARQLSPEEGWATAVALTSAQSSPGARHASREQSFPVGTEEMLSSQLVADAAHRFLAERGA